MAVIEYVRPARVLRPHHEDIKIDGFAFPVVRRPWLPKEHDGVGMHNGHCWVTRRGHPREPCLLTANHVVEEDSVVGGRVRVTSRRRQVVGRLAARSERMDAAIVELDGGSPNVLEWCASRVVGYKPVRLMRTDSDGLDARVVELSGFFDGREYYRGIEPLQPALMMVSDHLGPGDSGCLVLDVEGEAYGHTAPYLLYQGKVRLGRGDAGYCLLLAQPLDCWNLETCALSEDTDGGCDATCMDVRAGHRALRR